MVHDIAVWMENNRLMIVEWIQRTRQCPELLFGTLTPEAIRSLYSSSEVNVKNIASCAGYFQDLIDMISLKNGNIAIRM